MEVGVEVEGEDEEEVEEEGEEETWLVPFPDPLPGFR